LRLWVSSYEGEIKTLIVGISVIVSRFGKEMQGKIESNVGERRQISTYISIVGAGYRIANAGKRWTSCP